MTNNKGWGGDGLDKQAEQPLTFSRSLVWLVNKESKPTLGKCPGPPASGYLPCTQELRADPSMGSLCGRGWGGEGGGGREKRLPANGLMAEESLYRNLLKPYKDENLFLRTVRRGYKSYLFPPPTQCVATTKRC